MDTKGIHTGPLHRYDEAPVHFKEDRGGSSAGYRLIQSSGRYRFLYPQPRSATRAKASRSGSGLLNRKPWAISQSCRIR